MVLQRCWWASPINTNDWYKYVYYICYMCHICYIWLCTYVTANNNNKLWDSSFLISWQSKYFSCNRRWKIPISTKCTNEFFACRCFVLCAALLLINSANLTLTGPSHRINLKHIGNECLSPHGSARCIFHCFLYPSCFDLIFTAFGHSLF